MSSSEDLFVRLEQLNEAGAALSRERHITSLLDQILLAAKRLTRADGGTLYRMSEDRQALRFEILHTDSLGIAMGGNSGHRVELPDLPLLDSAGQPNNNMVAVCAVNNRRTINVADAYTDSTYDFSGTRRFDQLNSYRSKSLLAVPMKDQQGQIIGVLQLINSVHPGTGEIQAFSMADQSLVEWLASQAAIALSNRLLLTQLETLFESLIKLINTAIEDKSKYTGGHCSRVPELTLMLADAAAQTTQGPLADFTMSEQDRYELKIAGLLHDCGKITTPVHVVDKATKLQTLFDRIGLIDTRFEVLKRDAQIAALQKQLASRVCVDSQAEALAESNCRAELTVLDADRDFLRVANLGSEAMDDAALARVEALASSRTWRNPEGQEAVFLSPDEQHNLSIRAGTLTAAERGVINHHIVATNKMLEQLPWPSHLRRVPEFAGGHHERMDGKGYPKGLRREQMSVQARIMGIADIFEALTAADRPYKKGMTLSQSVAILRKLKESGHIDPDLFDVFISQGVYLRYAQQFLPAAQIDLAVADLLAA
ncbi:MAG: GAF domain-containing protein [Rhodoferax sp.]|nr:GAF domain-containing protein [Rhodoferax sp.]